MNIIYNDVDITNSVQTTTAQITDNAGGKPDSLTVVFSDTDGLWSKWKPAKNDTVRITHNGFDTGTLFVDELWQRSGSFEIKALSIPQTSKSAHTQGWEKVRLLEIATEIATRHGLTLQSFEITNHLYERVDQQEIADFAFLADFCMLEGYALKINNRSVVIYSESFEEQKPVNPNISVVGNGSINDADFRNKSTDTYQKCIVRSNDPSYIEGEFSDPNIFGPTIKRDLYATNQAEAIRWARGVLRSYNKLMVTGSMAINLNTNYAAGTSLNVQDIGLFDGKYFIHALVHDFINNKTKLTLRKPLEGY